VDPVTLQSGAGVADGAGGGGGVLPAGTPPDGYASGKALSLEPAHGYGIAQRLEQISKSVVQVNQGSLYPALHRLEQKGWLKSDWKQSETGREAKFYSLTRSGQRQLRAERDSWARLTGAVQLIFDEGSAQ
jgi:transcriptional regulator